MVLHCHVISKDHVIKGSCNFMSKSPLKVSHHPAKWLSALWKLRHNGSSLSYELKRPLDEKAMWLYGWDPHTVSHHHGKFCGHQHFDSDNRFLVVEEKDSISRLNPPLKFISKTPGTPCSYTKNFIFTEQFPHKYFQCVLWTLLRTGHTHSEKQSELCIKSFCQSVQKHWPEGEKKKAKAIAKFSALLGKTTSVGYTLHFTSYKNLQIHLHACSLKVYDHLRYFCSKP